jgi:hypothetical protein
MLLVTCYYPHKVDAHLPGQEPYFKINNKFTSLYPVLLVPSSGEFTLPQDIAPDRYKVNEEISFEIVKDKLPFSTETVDNSEFYWDFGDGQKTTGLSNTHTFTKIGSYVVTIHIDYDRTDEKEEKELLQSTLLHITNDPKRPLPKVEIKINGKVFDKEKANLTLDLSKEHTFEASVGKEENASFIWDMSDGALKKGNKIIYEHKDNFLILNPVVRATTKDGFIYDAEVIIENTKTSQEKNTNILLLLVVVNGAALLLFAGYLILSKKKRGAS